MKADGHHGDQADDQRKGDDVPTIGQQAPGGNMRVEPDVHFTSPTAGANKKVTIA